MAGPDYISDIGGQRQPTEAAKQTSSDTTARPWLAIRWRCCSTYGRIYRNAKQTAYEGRCPRCYRAVNIPIGPDGMNNRFFDAY